MSRRCGSPAAEWRSESAGPEWVGIAFKAEDLSVMDEPVDHRGGGHVVAEDLTPPGERLVAGDDHRCAFVAAGDEHEHQARGLGVERDVADLVADQQRDPLQAVELVVELALALRVGEHARPIRSRCVNRTRWPARHARIPRAIAMWVLPVPGGPSRITFCFGVQEVELAEVLDHLLLHAALEGEVEHRTPFIGPPAVRVVGC